jgi:hypothetical protein
MIAPTWRRATGARLRRPNSRKCLSSACPTPRGRCGVRSDAGARGRHQGRGLMPERLGVGPSERTPRSTVGVHASVWTMGTCASTPCSSPRHDVHQIASAGRRSTDTSFGSTDQPATTARAPQLLDRANVGERPSPSLRAAPNNTAGPLRPYLGSPAVAGWRTGQAYEHRWYRSRCRSRPLLK